MNLLKLTGKKILLVAVVAVHWVLDDVIVILPDAAVWAITGALFTITGNSGRFDSFKAFWSEPVVDE